MCGVYGFVNTPQRGEPVRVKMQDEILHRGPDSQEHYTNREACIGFNRLSIIDLDNRAMQPMLSPDGKVVLTFNGEIYNYRALRKDLQDRGIHFKTTGDAEVLLQTYLTYGLEETLEKINGMFAIAIYHVDSQKLILVRDRLGKKPLYYQHINGHIIYASELKSLQVHPDFVKEIDAENAQRFLIFGGIPAPYTMYKSTYKLEAGHYAVYENSRLKTKCFWDIDYKKKDNSISKERAYSEFSELLNDSFLIRQDADVPKALYLSGGIDSTLLAKMFHDNKIDIETITSTFANQKANEEQYAQEVINRYRMSSNKLLIDLPHEKLNTLMGHLDEPFADPAVLPMMMMSEKVSELGYKVVFTGDGGDELLGGYHSRQDYSFQSRMLFDLLTPLNIHTNSFSSLKYLNPKYRSTTGFFQKFFTLNSLDKRRYLELIDEVLQPLISRSSSFLEFRQQFFLFRMKNFYNYKVDRATMAYSIEARSPLQDYRLLEYVSKLPTNYYCNPKERGKIFLKRQVLDDFPSSFVSRPKRGFGVPIGDFVDQLPLSDHLQKASDILKIPFDEKVSHKRRYLLYSLGHWLDSNS